jgi:hypothetical protein
VSAKPGIIEIIMEYVYIAVAMVRTGMATAAYAIMDMSVITECVCNAHLTHWQVLTKLGASAIQIIKYLI